MKLTLIMILAGVVYASASTYAQEYRVSVNVKNGTFYDVVTQIEKQSEFLFFYKSEEISNSQRVTLVASNKLVGEILNDFVRERGLSYRIMDRHILITKASESQQQGRRISGTVVDANNEPIIGASIIEKSAATNGTVTDIDGNFSLSVAPGATVKVSFVGYVSQEIVTGSQTTFRITLAEDSRALEEVVVVGYGSQKKAHLTGAVSTVSLPEMEKRTVAQTSLALQGLVPGVVVTQRSGKPGGDGGIISVRGKTTLGNNDVLVLIDGVESNINSIDSKMIESVSVLKDAASAAIYGNRAANGVILITTKRAEDGKAYISYNGYVAQGKPTNVPKYVGAVDFMKYISIAKRAVGMTPEYSEEYISEYEEGVRRGDPNYPDVDWFDATVTNDGLINSHFVTVSLGKKEIRSIAQVGYLSQNGLTENTNFKRYTLRSNTDFNISEKIEVRTDLALVYSEANEPSKLGTGYNWVGRIPANQAAFLADGRYGPGWQGVNPVAYYKDGGVITRTDPSAIINLVAKYNPIKNLEIKGQYAVNYWEGHTTNWDKRVQLYLNDGTPDPQTQSKSTLRENTGRNLRTMFNGSATFNHSLNQTHNFKLMAGYQQESFWNKWHEGYREIFPFPDYPVLNAGGQENQKSNGSASDYALQSAFGRFNYNFKERYLLEAVIRYDGSSRFADGYKWGTFPSVSAGWRVSEEAFWADLKPMINNLKLKVSYGQLGNQNTLNGYYPAQSVVNLGTNYIFNKTITSGAALTAMANSLISWETTTQTNVGLDINLFNKLEINADYYYRLTDDILLNLNIPLIIGLSAPAQNAGKLENRGWEVGATYNDKFGDFNFSAMFNISDVKNKILDMKGINETGISVNREGYPMYSLYGYEADGYIVPEDYDADGKYMGATQIGSFGPGDIKYKDQLTVDTDGDGIPDAADGVINTSDYVIMGSTIPRYTFGLSLFAEYKGIDLNVLFQGTGKANGYVWGHSIGSFYEGGSMPEIGKDYWTPENRDAQFPRLAFNNSNNQQNSSFWVKDASYLRLKNLQLGYTIPKQLTSKIGVSTLRFYVSTDNLFTVSNFWKYFDVEAPVLTGYSNFYPLMRTTTFGIDLRF
ncbi:MAG: TonB-dependent receptor [Tannerellaceae bacterium]|jgi:TonB-linked SusC/RagA family outer membrane protein|nr:TonB-dependent receptor [Tannerellaceae bacterium]